MESRLSRPRFASTISPTKLRTKAPASPLWRWAPPALLRFVGTELRNKAPRIAVGEEAHPVSSSVGSKSSPPLYHERRSYNRPVGGDVRVGNAEAFACLIRLAQSFLIGTQTRACARTIGGEKCFLSVGTPRTGESSCRLSTPGRCRI